jgi:hypothetical protein
MIMITRKRLDVHFTRIRRGVFERERAKVLPLARFAVDYRALKAETA